MRCYSTRTSPWPPAVGQPDAYAGELPVAYVTLKAGATADAESLLAFVAPRVGEPAARPKRICVLGEMPVTPVGKIYKTALRVLATRRVVEETLRAIGLDPAQFALDVSERETTVCLNDAAHKVAVKAALLGMPIRYSIRSGAA
jgi:fatty-acyl-CoA synthase